MGFLWSDDLSTGIEEIDAQHKALLEQFDALLDACREQKGVDELGRFLTFLTGYVNLHFDEEEREMIRVSYSGLERHQAEHAKYRVKLAALKEGLKGAEPPDRVAADALWLAAEWFVDHIRQVDMAMAAALRSGKNEPGRPL